MNSDDLKKLLLNELSRETKLLAVNVAANSPNLIEQLWVWLTMEHDPLRWRACWIFEEICMQHSNIKKQYLKKIALRYPTLTHGPSQRMLGKILAFSEVSEKQESEVLNTAFHWLQDPHVPIAARVHAMQIAFNLTKKYPDLKQELQSILQHHYDTGSKGFKNRAQKILAKL